LYSGLDGFHSFFGSLDGDKDGSPGGDYRHSFTFDKLLASSDQTPRDPQAWSLPIYLTSDGDVKSISLPVKTDPSRLAISSATLGDSLPAGSQIELLPQGNDLVKLTITSPQALPAGKHLVAHLHARGAAESSAGPQAPIMVAAPTAAAQDEVAAPAVPAASALAQHGECAPDAAASASGDPVSINLSGVLAGFALGGAAAFGYSALRGRKAKDAPKASTSWQSAFLAGGLVKRKEDPNRDLRVRIENESSDSSSKTN
jgi:hypothetical protein